MFLNLLPYVWQRIHNSRTGIGKMPDSSKSVLLIVKRYHSSRGFRCGHGMNTIQNITCADLEFEDVENRCGLKNEMHGLALHARLVQLV